MHLCAECGGVSDEPGLCAGCRTDIFQLIVDTAYDDDSAPVIQPVLFVPQTPPAVQLLN